MFEDVLFPKSENKQASSKESQDLQLRRYMRYQAHPNAKLDEVAFTVFDFETTGLNSTYDKIIEIGAQKIINFKVV